MRAIYYRTDTGQIMWTTPVTEGMVVECRVPGHDVIETDTAGDVDSTHYVNPQTRALVAYPPKPSQHCVFDYGAGTWKRDLVTSWGVVRYQRDQKLAATDWTTLADVPLTPEVRAAWMAYRQALRDVTDQPDPDALVWPVPPA